MSVVLPQHRDLSIFHNFHMQQECTVEELFEHIPFNPAEWDSELAFQKAKATNEMWSMHWLREDLVRSGPPEGYVPPSDGTMESFAETVQSVHSLYAPTFKDLMKLMMTNSFGALIDYQ